MMSARPGRMISEHKVPFARPRSLETTYKPEFTELTHTLRDQIQAARAKPTVAA
jgi:NitT/TauT family transport system ATP-binding protein